MAGILILNAADQVVNARFDNAGYVFKAGERKEIFNTFAARHILSRWGKHGLVDITYSDKVAEDFIAPELYVHSQTISSVKALLERLEESSLGFKTYDDQFGDMNTHERAENKKLHKVVLAKVESVKARLKTLEGVSTDKIVKECAQDMKKRAEKLLSKANSIINGKESRDTKDPASAGSTRP